MRFNAIDWVALVVAILGALNWGLIGIFKYDVVKELFGNMSSASRVIYTIVGVAGLWLIYTGYRAFAGTGAAARA